MSLSVPVSAPWFDSWRDTFLQVQFPSDHEFTKHYLACILLDHPLFLYTVLILKLHFENFVRLHIVQSSGTLEGYKRYYYKASERIFVELIYHTSIDEAMALKHEM